MTSIKVRYAVVTPMMLGGANNVSEFRLASYVDVVRWWWRFLALGRFKSAEVATFWEALLFGWSTAPFGQKRVRFKLTGIDRNYPEGWGVLSNVDWCRNWSGISYLTAQGFKNGRLPVEARSIEISAQIRDLHTEQLKEAFAKQFKSELPAFARGQLHDQPEANWRRAHGAVVDAMALIGLLGGLGARSRRGFGSLAVQSLEFPEEFAQADGRQPIPRLPRSVADYARQVVAHLGADRHAGLPSYSAFSDLTRISVVASASDARQLMNDTGFAMQVYRTWGQRRQNGGHEHIYRAGEANINDAASIPAGGMKASYEFKADHDWYVRLKAQVDACRDELQELIDESNFSRAAEKAARQRRDGNLRNEVMANDPPKRIAFGLPHNYFVRSSEQVIQDSGKARWESENVNIEPAVSGRRASPLFIHFHKLSSGRVIAVLSVVPGRFLPDEARVRVYGQGSAPLSSNTHLQDYRHVTGLIGFIAGGNWKGGLAKVATACERTDIIPEQGA